MTVFETCPICKKQVHEYDGTLQAHITTQHRYPELVEACRKAHDLLNNGWKGAADDFRYIKIKEILGKALENADRT